MSISSWVSIVYFDYTHTYQSDFINTLRPTQNGRHFADDVFKCIFLNEDVWIPNQISLKFVPKGPINNIPALVQIMAWRRPGDKPLSKPMMVSLTTHVCVTWPQWVNLCFNWLHSASIHYANNKTLVTNLKPKELTLVKFESKYNVHFQWMHWKILSSHWGPFDQGFSMWECPTPITLYVVDTGWRAGLNQKPRLPCIDCTQSSPWVENGYL